MIRDVSDRRLDNKGKEAAYACKQAEQPGGCAAQRNMEREKQQLLLLQKKWGSDIVQIDMTNRSHNLKRSKKNYFDFNPIIRVPIKGV